jgi:hypothetical protein
MGGLFMKYADGPSNGPPMARSWATLQSPCQAPLVQLTETGIGLQIHGEGGSEGRCGVTGPGEWARHDPHRCGSGRQPRCYCVGGIVLVGLDRLVCPSHHQPHTVRASAPVAHDVDH